VDNFELDEYYKNISSIRYSGPCKEDCFARYLCGGICWTNISYNKYLCELMRLLLPYALYIKANYIHTNDIIRI